MTFADEVKAAFGDRIVAKLGELSGGGEVIETSDEEYSWSVDCGTYGLRFVILEQPDGDGVGMQLEMIQRNGPDGQITPGNWSPLLWTTSAEMLEDRWVHWFAGLTREHVLEVVQR